MLQTSFSHIVFMTFILAIWHVKSHPNLTETEYMKTSKTFVVLKPYGTNMRMKKQLPQ